jgi:uncharacterized phage-associated protein
MARVEDVAAYILERMGSVTVMKVQKLSYYCYGFHLAWEEEPLFPERFEARVNESRWTWCLTGMASFPRTNYP